MGNEHRNMATAQVIYEAFGKGDLETILAHVSDEVRWETWDDNRAQQAGVPWLAKRSGTAGVQAFFESVGTGFEIRDLQVLGMMAGGNQVGVTVLMDATIRATGKHLRDEELHVWTFDDSGRVVGLRHYVDTAKHIEAAAG